MIGLDSAGKTTILYRLRMKETYGTVPTVGFNVEEFEHKKFSINIWDMGGQTNLRRLWRHYFAGTQGVIYVVDCSDHARLEESKKEFIKVITDREMRDCRCVLVYANKQDEKGALNASDIPELLGLDTMKNIHWMVQPSCAVSGDGVESGLDWMTDAVYKMYREERLQQRSRSKLRLRL